MDLHADIYRFVKELIGFRNRHPAFHRPEFYTGKDASFNAIPDITWLDEKGKDPDWARIERLIVVRLDGSKADIVADRDDNDFVLVFNARSEIVPFILCPAPPGKKWYRVVDTSLPSPEDILTPGKEEAVFPQGEYVARPRSFVLFLSRI